MLVTIDVEWKGTEGRERLTQISARMYLNGWAEVDRFQAIMHFDSKNPKYYTHVAFGGYPMEQFVNGETEADALTRLADWLNHDDTLCFWCGTGKRALTTAWKRQFGTALPYRVSVAQQEVRKAFQLLRGADTNPYRMLSGLGETIPGKEHCSESDIEVMGTLLLLSGLSVLSVKKIGCRAKEPTSQRKPKANVQEKNRNIIAKCGFHYIYLPNSAIFHTADCACMRRAAAILGSVYYKTASESRRPCKICKPDMTELYERNNYKVNKKRAEIPADVIESLCGNRESGGINGIFPEQMLAWQEKGTAYGLDFYCLRKYRDLFYKSDFGFWRIHWNRREEYVLFHLNQEEFDKEKTARAMAHGHFHRQGDVPVSESLSGILTYIRDHDRAKKIIADDYRNLPKRTKREKRYYEQAAKRAEHERRKRLFTLLDQVAEELKMKEAQKMLEYAG